MPLTEHQAFLIKYLELIKEANTKTHQGFNLKDKPKYMGYGDMWLQLGAFFNPVSPPNIPNGEPQQCFKNALELAQQDFSLTYCEGWATLYIPTEHAWVLNQKGEVIDNTWQVDKNQQVTYFGIPFGSEFLFEYISRAKVYSVISNDMLSDFELVTKGLPDGAINWDLLSKGMRVEQ